MTSFDAGLGAWMASVRERHGVAQEALATQLGLAQSAISKVERGRRRVCVEELLAWALALGVDLSEVHAQLERLAATLARPGYWERDDLRE